ncbi:A/G-specific adenine glycosylase [Halomonas sp. Bachu 37]|uniref:A/G-specific adenine glycosylase n=1 Tax=Halomonas kashgarensis TaxID=3084920 RepID=UPI003216A939
MTDEPAPVMAPEDFQQRLLAWFDRHGRHDLPWQKPRTPYRVWVSEIMLQQTQVATVLPYFERFMGRFSTIEALAEAEQDEVLHLWTGLGYYARARNMHKSARLVVQQHDGELPVHDMDAMLALPGIGRSTAGAIIAQSTGRRAVILDGNVKRTLSRLHALPGWPGQPRVERKLWELAEHYTPSCRLTDYTQAVMDFGATLCRRGQPECSRCPFNDVCIANVRGEQKRFPESKPKKTLPVRRAWMLMLNDARGRIWLEQRPPAGVWGGLWTPPQFDDQMSLRAWLDQHVPGAIVSSPEPVFTHTFSHFRLEIIPQPVRCDRLDAVREGGCWYDPEFPPALGVAAPVKLLLERQAPFALKPQDSPGKRGG